MTREEEIHNFIKDSGICDYKYDDLLDYNEYGGGDVICAFIEGAEWADNNPDLSSLWHEAREKPIGEDWVILCENKNGHYWVMSKLCVSTFYFNWQQFIIEHGELTRWAYIKDLLPK